MPLMKKEQLAGMNIHYMKYSLDYFLSAQERIGFESIELWGGIPHVYLDSNEYTNCQLLKKKIQEYHLKIKVFTPENCMYQYQFAAAKPEIFKKSMEYFKNGICMAQEMECPIMQCNSGWGYLDETRDAAWNRCVEMLQELTDFAAERGVLLAMESLRPEESNLVIRLEDAKAMKEQVGAENLKILVDTTAMGVAGETLEQWFTCFGNDIVHMHFVDGNPYGHLIWGDGCRNLEEDLEVLKKYGYQGALGQEITDSRYFKDPMSHDQRNWDTFSKWMEV